MEKHASVRALGMSLVVMGSWSLLLGPRLCPAAEKTPALEPFVIAVGGDTLPESSWSGPQEADHFLDGVRGEFARADLVFVNLEEPITASETVTRHKRPADVRSGRDYILRARNMGLFRILKDAGVGAVGLANNHMMDYTERGLRDTLQGLRGVELPAVGAGLKPDAERAFVFERRGLRVALLAFSDVVPDTYEATDERLGIASSKDGADLIHAVERARGEADFVVLMIHWGGQGSHVVEPRQRHLARIAAEAGCDVVVGMHPHVLQGVEFVGRVPVFYSVGNFSFPAKRLAAREGVLVRLLFGARGLEAVELVPVEISPDGAPQVADGKPGQELLAHLDRLCASFNSRVEGGRLLPGRRKQAFEQTPGYRPPKARTYRRQGRRSGWRGGPGRPKENLGGNPLQFYCPSTIIVGL